MTEKTNKEMQTKKPKTRKTNLWSPFFWVRSIGTKIMLCLMMFFVPLALLLYFFVQSENTSINFGQKEIWGVKYIEPLKDMAYYIPYRQTLVQNYIFGDKKLKSSIEKIDQRIQKSLQKLEEVDAMYGKLLVAKETQLTNGMKEQNKQKNSIDTHERFINLKQEYENLRSKGLNYNIITSNREHQKLSKLSMDLIRQVGDVSNLILDPDLDSYYLMDLSVVKLPKLLKTIGELNLKVTLYLSNKNAQTVNAKADIDILKYKLDELIRETMMSFDTAFMHNPAGNIANLTTRAKYLEVKLGNLLKALNVEILSQYTPLIDSDDFLSVSSKASSQVFDLYTYVNQELIFLLEERISVFEQERNLHLLQSFFFIMLSLLSAVLLIRGISSGLRGVISSFEEIGAGNYNSEIVVNRRDEIGRVQDSLIKMRDDLKNRLEDERAAAEVNARIKQALDNSSTATMVIDANKKVVYINNSLTMLLGKYQNDISVKFSNFNVDDLMGADLNVLLEDSSEFSKILASVEKSIDTEVIIGNICFHLILNPVCNVDKEFIGTIIEWKDRTVEIHIEKEIDQLVQAAAQGDLTDRISLEGKEGFYATLSNSLNSVVDMCQKIIADAVSSLESMAHGNLTRYMVGEYKGDFERLKEDTNMTLDKLVSVITKIRMSSSHMSDVSGDIAKGNNSLAQRTEAQASSLKETAASMDEMTAGIKSNLEKINSARDLVLTAGDKAKEGGEVIVKAVDAMTDLNESSKKIASIINVINDIAFQTNLLALNASVEAARAGEQGRGFAVVAEEVRNLAQRTAKSSKEIESLIQDSSNKVENGVELVNLSGKHLEHIIDAVNQVNDITNEVSKEASEQTDGITQMNTSISQMDGMTQQNAALVEELATAGQSMSGQANDLLQLVNFFKTNKEDLSESNLTNDKNKDNPESN